MLQWFIRFPQFIEFPFHLGKTPLWHYLFYENSEKKSFPDVSKTVTHHAIYTENFEKISWNLLQLVIP